MLSIPNGFKVIAQTVEGFAAVHKLSGKVILGRTARDTFGNEYVTSMVTVERGGCLVGTVSGMSADGSTQEWRQLMAYLMAEVVQAESNRVRDERRAVTAGR
jgi:hypothetical protein